MKAKLYSVPNTLLSSYKKIRTTKLSCKEKAISNPLLEIRHEIEAKCGSHPASQSVVRRRRTNHEIIWHPEQYTQDSVIPRVKSTRMITVLLRRAQTKYKLARGGVLIFCPQVRR